MNFIINPINHKKYSIFSNQGKTLLKKYISNYQKIVNGGSSYQHSLPKRSYKYSRLKTQNSKKKTKQRTRVINKQTKFLLKKNYYKKKLNEANTPTKKNKLFEELNTQLPASLKKRKPIRITKISLLQLMVMVLIITSLKIEGADAAIGDPFYIGALAKFVFENLESAMDIYQEEANKIFDQIPYAIDKGIQTIASFVRPTATNPTKTLSKSKKQTQTQTRKSKPRKTTKQTTLSKKSFEYSEYKLKNGFKIILVPLNDRFGNRINNMNRRAGGYDDGILGYKEGDPVAHMSGMDSSVRGRVINQMLEITDVPNTIHKPFESNGHKIITVTNRKIGWVEKVQTNQGNFARYNNYEYKVGDADKYAVGLQPYWKKIDFAIEELKTMQPNKVLLWIDDDIVIMKKEDWLMPYINLMKATNSDFVATQDAGATALTNTGMFLVKNSKGGRHILQKIREGANDVHVVPHYLKEAGKKVTLGFCKQREHACLHEQQKLDTILNEISSTPTTKVIKVTIK